MPQTRSICFFDAYSTYAGTNRNVINLQSPQYSGQANARGANNATCRDALIAELISDARWPESRDLTPTGSFAVSDDFTANTGTLGSLVLGTAKTGNLEVKD